MKEILISKTDQGQRADKFVRKYLSNAPLSFIYKLFRIKDVKINGKRINRDYILKENDVLRIYVSDDQLLEFNKTRVIVKTKLPLSIIYEDDNILIVNKPSGLLVHGDEKEKRITLTNMVCTYLMEKENYNLNSQFIPSPCHRLDRNTSGLVVFAKNIESLHLLEELFKEKKQLKKEYICLVEGKLYGNNKIDAPLYKNEKTKTVSVRSEENGGKKAITLYEVMENFADCSLIRARIITGRTHQIRVHFSYIGHPILGDSKYGNFTLNKRFKELYHYENQFLHAEKLTFLNIEGILSYLSNKVFECPLPEKEALILSDIKKKGKL